MNRDGRVSFPWRFVRSGGRDSSDRCRSRKTVARVLRRDEAGTAQTISRDQHHSTRDATRRLADQYFLTFVFSFTTVFLPFSSTITFCDDQWPGTKRVPLLTDWYSGSTHRTSAPGRFCQLPETHVHE